MRPSGIGPEPARWQRAVLPLNYGRSLKDKKGVI